MSKSTSLSLPIQRQYQEEVVRALFREKVLPRDHYVCQLCGWLVERPKTSGFCLGMMVQALTHIGPDRVCRKCYRTAYRTQQTGDCTQVQEWLAYLLTGNTRYCVICQKEISKESAHRMGYGWLCQHCCTVLVLYLCQYED